VGSELTHIAAYAVERKGTGTTYPTQIHLYEPLVRFNVQLGCQITRKYHLDCGHGGVKEGWEKADESGECST
jgi:hypothetical protein